MPFTGGGVLILRLSDIDLGLDGILFIMSRINYANGRMLSSLNGPLSLVKLHAPFEPFQGSLYIFAHLASPASFFAVSETAPNRHLL